MVKDAVRYWGEIARLAGRETKRFLHDHVLRPIGIALLAFGISFGVTGTGSGLQSFVITILALVAYGVLALLRSLALAPVQLDRLKTDQVAELERGRAGPLTDDVLLVERDERLTLAPPGADPHGKTLFLKCTNRTAEPLVCQLRIECLQRFDEGAAAWVDGDFFAPALLPWTPDGAREAQIEAGDNALCYLVSREPRGGVWSGVPLPRPMPSSLNYEGLWRMELVLIARNHEPRPIVEDFEWRLRTEEDRPPYGDLQFADARDAIPAPPASASAAS